MILKSDGDHTSSYSGAVSGYMTLCGSLSHYKKLKLHELGQYKYVTSRLFMCCFLLVVMLIVRTIATVAKITMKVKAAAHMPLIAAAPSPLGSERHKLE